MSIDARATRRDLRVGGSAFEYYSIAAAEDLGLAGVSRLPFSLKVVLENVLRQHAEGRSDGADIGAVAGWLAARRAEREIAFRFTRVLMPDSSGVPLLGDLAAMRDAMIRLGGDPARLNPSVPIEVVGCRLIGKLKPGVTATDLVLTVTQTLRRHKLVDKFVEYFGPGVGELALPDRATVANMSPENGATMGFFPVDAETLRYLRLTGRDEAQLALVEAYCQAQGLWRDANTPPPEFSELLEIDLSTVEPSVAGPSRPQDRVPLREAPLVFKKFLGREVPEKPTLKDGDVVIAAITRCTNTSNPAVMFA